MKPSLVPLPLGSSHLPLPGPDSQARLDSGWAVSPRAAHNASDVESRTRRAIMEELLLHCAADTTSATGQAFMPPCVRAAQGAKTARARIPGIDDASVQICDEFTRRMSEATRRSERTRYANDVYARAAARISSSLSSRGVRL